MLQVRRMVGVVYRNFKWKAVFFITICAILMCWLAFRTSELTLSRKVKPLLTGRLQLNIVDEPITVRIRLFGYFKLPLSASETEAEARWIQRYSSILPPAKDCNRFKAPPQTEAVMVMHNYLIHNRFDNKTKTKSEVVHTLGPGQIPTKFLHAEEEVKKNLKRDGFIVKQGGWFRPTTCNPTETVAVVIPYRDRHNNLINFLNYMHRFLQRQRRHYVIVVAEQVNDVLFNRAKLFNAVLQELMRDHPEIECLVLNDVDKVPYHLFNLFGCGYQPKQLATMAWNETSRSWRNYYETFFGGVTSFTKWQLLRMNGGSNSFYGWGGEDDDFLGRAYISGHLPSLPSKYVGRVWVMGHHNDTHKITDVTKMLWSDEILKRMRSDGLREVKYKRLYRWRRPLYTVYGFEV